MNSPLKHSPGPWVFKLAYAGGHGSFAGRDGKGVACISGAIKRPVDENLANAALIAAAPAMYAALVAIAREAGPAFGNNADDPGSVNKMSYLARAALAAIDNAKGN